MDAEKKYFLNGSAIKRGGGVKGGGKKIPTAISSSGGSYKIEGHVPYRPPSR